MATRSLVRSGASLMSRLLTNPIPQQTFASPIERVVSPNFEITPRLFPSLSKLDISIHLPPKNDADAISKLTTQGFLHPCGLPSLPFFCPEGDADTENAPMECFRYGKGTFQPSTLRRKRNHGFFARKATKGGRRVIARRIAKGRWRVTA